MMYRIINSSILVLCIFVFYMNIRFVNSKQAWSPIDEYGHYDYIDKLSSGRIPKLSDPISEELFEHIKNNPHKSVSGIVNTREELGFGNYSYQAKHPPLYYLVLLLPDMGMKKMTTPIFTRLKVLRVLSHVIFFIGLLVLIPIARILSEHYARIPLFYVYGCVLFGLMIATHERYGLGNNLMSPLMVNSTVLFMLRYYFQLKNKDLFLFVLFSGLAVCTALPNLFILPCLLFLMGYKFIKYFSVQGFFFSIGSLIVPAVILFVWQKMNISEPVFEAQMQQVLLAVIPANAIGYSDFIKILMNDTFQLTFLKQGLDISSVVFTLIVINVILCLIFIKTVWLKHKWLLFVFLQFIVFMITLYFLNKYIPRVTWVAFRHYLGFIPVVYVGITAFVLIVYQKLVQQKMRGDLKK